MTDTEHRQLGMAPKNHFIIDWEKRDKFVVEYCRTGSRKEAIAATGVSAVTAGRWLKETWFTERVIEVKRVMDRQMEGRITHILEETFSQIQTRLTEGDPKLLKDGTTTFVPVAIRDLTVLAGVMFDKRAALRRDDNPENGDVTSSLDKIAAELRKFDAAGGTNALRDAAAMEVEATEISEDNPLFNNNDLI